ncbi:MAG: endonuclease domain-containing protein [Anaerolineaceae bacterium]|nr:endonuclease domain-containing protein [Anaerolineaceae bacterium]
MDGLEQISRDTRDKLIEAAREMRRYPTEAEALLWEALRKKQLDDFKFRRQHIIQTFIVDFYCPKKKMIIEIDGDIHITQAKYDAFREDALTQMGYTVIRFTNEQVMEQTSSVLGEIRRILSEE